MLSTSFRSGAKPATCLDAGNILALGRLGAGTGLLLNRIFTDLISSWSICLAVLSTDFGLAIELYLEVASLLIEFLFLL